MTVIRSSTSSGLVINSDNSSNVFFVTGSSNLSLRTFADGAVIPSRLVVPAGNVQTRQSNPSVGSLRFNTQSNIFETYTGFFWDPTISRDLSYRDTILHIAGNGGSNTNNSIFIEESANAFSVSAFGNSAQGSFSPYQTGWSVYFDGSDFLSNTASATFNTSTGGAYDFTIECWLYQTSRRITPNSGRSVIWDPRSADNTSGPVFAITGTTGQLEISANTAAQASALHRSDSTIPLNTWNHIAYVRRSNVLYYFINGVQDSNTYLLNIPYSAQTPKIGGTNNGTANANNFQGFISNFRFTKSAVYSNNFVVSTNPLPNLSNTVILTCNDPYIWDDSSFKNDITKSGEAYVSTFCPFPLVNKYVANISGGSLFLNGSEYRDYLTLPFDSRQNINSNVQYCFEFWHYPTDRGANATLDHIIVNRNWNYGASGGIAGPTWGIRLINGGVTPELNFNGTGSAANVLISSARSGQLRQWNHYVFTRDFTGMNRIFVNGVLGQTRADIQAMTSSFGDVTIGTASETKTGTMRGYLAGLHMIVGDSIPSLYRTTNTTVGAIIFTPPTTPPIRNNNTVFLLNFENAAIYDSTLNNNLNIVGNVRIRTDFTTPQDYGNSSIFFDGLDDVISMAHRDEQLLGTGNFTIESWIYRTNSNTHTIFNKGNSFSTQGLQLSITSANTLVLTDSANSIVGSTESTSVGFIGTTADYMSYLGNVRHAFLSNNFTIECWVYPETSGVTQGIVNNWQGGGAWSLALYANNVLSFNHTPVAGSTNQRGIGTGAAVVPSNTWSHIAVTKQWGQNSNTSGNLRIFINGQLAGANTNHIERIEFFGNTVKSIRVGIGNDLANPFRGRIADLRIVHGTALYTANFTLPNTPLPLVSNTVLLSLQNGTITDLSQFSTPYFRTGNVSVNTFGPYANANIFTIPVLQWTHIAAVRTGNLANQVKLYINGNTVGTGTITTDYNIANTAIFIGENHALANSFAGYMRDFRITRSARYTNNFNPLGKLPEKG